MDELRIRGKLLNAGELLADLFSETSRPRMRWLRAQTRAGSIPFIRIGRLVFFDPEMVRTSLAERNLVMSRSQMRHRAVKNGAGRL